MVKKKKFFYSIPGRNVSQAEKRFFFLFLDRISIFLRFMPQEVKSLKGIVFYLGIDLTGKKGETGGPGRKREAGSPGRMRGGSSGTE